MFQSLDVIYRWYNFMMHGIIFMSWYNFMIDVIIYRLNRVIMFYRCMFYNHWMSFYRVSVAIEGGIIL